MATVDSTSGGIPLGRVAGLPVAFELNTVPCMAALWLVFGLAGHYAFGAGWAGSIVGGLVLALLHYAADVAHQMGHMVMARRTGHPMTGIKFYAIFSLAVYPPDEPPLPAATHIRRALGGPAGGAAMSLVALVVFLAISVFAPRAAWVGLILVLDSLLVFTLGSFLPLGFTDGSTLLHWMRRR